MHICAYINIPTLFCVLSVTGASVDNHHIILPVLGLFPPHYTVSVMHISNFSESFGAVKAPSKWLILGFHMYEKVTESKGTAEKL